MLSLAAIRQPVFHSFVSFVRSAESISFVPTLCTETVLSFPVIRNGNLLTYVEARFYEPGSLLEYIIIFK